MKTHAVKIVMGIFSLAVFLTAAMAEIQSDQDKKNEKKENRWNLGEIFKRSKAFLVPARRVSFGPDVCGREWDFTKKDRGNFTFFDGVKDAHATNDGALAFTLTDKIGTLGWGNYGGTQIEKDRLRLWLTFDLKLKAKQSINKPTTFEARLWADGKRDDRLSGSRDQARFVKELKGTDWQELTFEMDMSLPQRDGFDFEIKGTNGNRIEIKDLTITRYENQGFFRKEFALPDGKVWRAVAEVGEMTELFINGREVPSNGARPNGMYKSESVDISDYFEPGKINCIALYGRRVGRTDGCLPYICMQGSVIMSSGERILIDTDSSWKWIRQAPDGWKKAGFDDSKWQRVADGRNGENNATARVNWALGYRGKCSRPVHDGYIRLVNPKDSQLYYNDREDMVFQVYAPNGLDKMKPEVEWNIGRYKDGALEESRKGTAKKFEYLGRSIRYTVNVGQLSRGVYVLKTTLKDGDKVLDDCVPEPLVVTGLLPMKWTDGDNYTQDMDLALEREIDMTNPEDGPWTESAGGERAAAPSKDPEAGIKTPAIVERNGLKYRETQSNYGAIISYLVEFKHPGDFYVMELDYPNDMIRRQAVACSARNWGLSSLDSVSKTSAGVCTGERYPLTDKMQTLRWLYRPDPGKHSLNLVNIVNGVRAAGAKLRVYHIKNGLPALRGPKAHTRWNGHLTERTREDRFGIRAEPPTEDTQGYTQPSLAEEKTQPVLEMCKLLESHLDSCENYARYMRFVGQNLHVMGNYQYSQNNPPEFVPAWSFPCARVKGGIRDVFARVLRDNNIDFYAHVEYVNGSSLIKKAAAQPGRPDTGFWDTLYFVKPDGKEYSLCGGIYGFNFNHPVVRAEMLSTAEEIAKKYQTLPNFKGIAWTPYFGGDFLPGYQPVQLHRGPLTMEETTMLGCDDVTIREFEKDTGSQVPFSLDDPDRFQKRHKYLNSDAMRDKWYAWRAERMKGFFRDVADTLHKARQDLGCVANLYMNPSHDGEWRDSGLSFRDFMYANGWNGELFAEDDNICLAQTMYGVMNKSHEATPVDKRYRGWDMSGLPERSEFFKAGKIRAVEIKHDWEEIEQMSWRLPYREGWPRQFQLTLMEQPDGNNTREVFARALIGRDPNIFYYGFSDATLLEGNEQPLREFNRALRSLPAEKFSPVDKTGLNTNLAIRELSKDEEYWFYVVNPGYWPVSGEITLENAEKVYDAVKNELKAKVGWRGQTTVDVELAPFGLVAFRIPAGKAKIIGWNAKVEKGKATEHLESIVANTERLLGIPAALAALRPDDEAFMRNAVAAAKKDIEKGEYASALFATSSDRFWLLKTEYMDGAAEYGAESERSAQMSTEKRKAKSFQTDKTPVIDGKLDDPVWKEAETYSGFIASDEMPAMASTSFQVANDNAGNIYLAIRCKDRKPGEIRMKADRKNEASVFQDDYVAMFIQPDTGQSTYYQMSMSAGGVKFDQKAKGSGDRDYDFAPPWDVKTAVTDDGWVAEVKLPASSLDGTIKSGQPWGFNIHRSFREQKIPVSSWSYTPAGWHDTDRFGRLEF